MKISVGGDGVASGSEGKPQPSLEHSSSTQNRGSKFKPSVTKSQQYNTLHTLALLSMESVHDLDVVHSDVTGTTSACDALHDHLQTTTFHHLHTLIETNHNKYNKLPPHRLV